MAEDEGTRNEISGSISGNAVQAGQVRDVYQGVHVHPPQPVEWPCRVGVVPQQADCFQHRDLSTTLADTAGAGETAVLTQVLAGLGGVGKTQLAAQFAEDRWNAGELDLLVWITASSREAIVSGYATAAAKIGLARSEGDEDRVGQRFLEWLGESDRRWLVVFDDVQEPGHLRGWWPPQRPTGRVVVTTRRQDAALAGHHRHLVEVGLFTPAEAIHYVEAKLADLPELAQGAAELAADLGYLPLALAQATAYLADRNLTCTDYRQRLAGRRRQLAELVPETGSLPDDHHDTVAATWALSLDWANQLNPAGLARPLLELAAVLDPNGIPADLFTSAAVRTHLADILDRPDSIEPDQVTDALQNLRRLSLVNLDHTDPHHGVRVHALVQRATRDTLTADQLATLAHTAADALTEIWPDIERDTTQSQALRANTDYLHTHTDTHLWRPDAHPVLFHAGNSLSDAGLVTHAATYFHHLHKRAQHMLGPDHRDTFATRSNLASARGHTGDAGGAVEAFEALLADELRVLGPDHPRTLTTRGNLAFWRGEAGDAAGAVAAFENLLADRRRVLGPDHPDTLLTRSNLVSWRGEAGDAAGAAETLEALLGDLLRVFGPDHPDTLTIRNNLAIWRGEAGDPAGAAETLEALLADNIRVLGPDHPSTLHTRGNLAYRRGEAGDAAAAAEAFEALLGDFLRVFGPDHPDTLTTRGNLAFSRGESRDAAGAVAAFENLLADRRRVLGPDHPDTLHARHNLAYWRGEAGDAAGAAEAFEALLGDLLRVFGPDHPDILHARHNLAFWQGEARDRAGVAEALEALLIDCHRVLGPDHPDTLLIRNNLTYLRGY